MNSLIYFTLRAIALPTAALSLTACFSFFRPARFVRHDADDLRREVHQYYEKEIMTNLVKAANGSFFIHTDVNQLNAAVTQKLAANVGGGQTLTNVNSRSGLTLSASNQALRPFTFSMSPEQDNSLNFNTVPVTNDPTLYNAYVSYINLEHEGTWDQPEKNDSGNAVVPNKLAQSPDVKTPQTSHGVKASPDATKADPNDRYQGMTIVQRALKTESGILTDLLEPASKKTPPKYPVKKKTKGCFTADPGKDTVKSIVRSKTPPCSDLCYVRGTLVVPSFSDEFRKRHFSSETITESPDNYFYWIPTQFAQDYFGLCMAIVGRQGSGGGTTAKPGLQLVIPANG